MTVEPARTPGRSPVRTGAAARPRPSASLLPGVRTPGWMVTTARRLGLVFAVLLVLLALLPWQQNAAGIGRVIAYVPAAREQQVDAPISGRVVEWLVREGDEVVAGQPLVELSDNDPDYVERLARQRELVEVQLQAALAKVAAAEAKLEAAEGARAAGIAAAEAKLDAAGEKVEAARQKVEAARASAQTASSQRTRAEALAGEGLRSTQSVEDYRLADATRQAKLAEAEADLRAAEADRTATISDRDKARTEGDGKLAEARGELQASLSAEQDYRQKLVDLDVKLARQATRVVLAPAPGRVARVTVGQGGAQVKEGQSLVVLVPTTRSRAVELLLDGNDVSLVRPGQEVRLQVEGWPALVLPGWPSATVGTFAGRVDFVDPVDDGKGSFRVVVLPDPDAEPPWPAPELLRQGVRAKGWVMLARVPLVYELWRQLNDFPPMPVATGTKSGPPIPVPEDKAGKAWKPK
ncbi:MAG: HlyD family efflux transporter periplasmic adaptor subunit [Alphaproteobacteria bacterium]|nr:HlyD family efflux transporter periplasmic adaptor subunit [Alphaproteobacteria bacterium]